MVSTDVLVSLMTGFTLFLNYGCVLINHSHFLVNSCFSMYQPFFFFMSKAPVTDKNPHRGRVLNEIGRGLKR